MYFLTITKNRNIHIGNQEKNKHWKNKTNLLWFKKKLWGYWRDSTEIVLHLITCFKMFICRKRCISFVHMHLFHLKAQYSKLMLSMKQSKWFLINICIYFQILRLCWYAFWIHEVWYHISVWLILDSTDIWTGFLFHIHIVCVLKEWIFEHRSFHNPYIYIYLKIKNIL